MPAAAQPSPACKPVVDAMHKQWTTPNHVTIMQSGRPVPIEAITIGDTIYVKSRNTWVKSPESAADSRVDDEAKLKNAKVYTCRSLPAASVNGVPADVFAIHTEDSGGTSDSQFWIARATGLPVKLETTVAGDKSRFSSTWDYANIHAPVVK
ncbi:MAG: hypothetical protein ACRD1V_11110 [Vicinamibacterales bacterium]